MNDVQLENAIRVELAGDAARTPAAGSTKLAVHAAVAGLVSPDEPQLARRWLLPMAAAAVLVTLAVAGVLVPKALTSHPARPATPKPGPTQPAVPPAPTPTTPLNCPSGQQVIDGLSAAFTDSDGSARLAYEYYCAGADGRRGFSTIEVFQDDQGRLTRVLGEPIGLYQSYLMSLTGTDGGVKFRSYNQIPDSFDGPAGTVLDTSYPVGQADSQPDVNPVAGACTADQLRVSNSQAGEPVPHTVLTLTNTSSTQCAIWGTPTYTIVGSVPARIRYLLSGPAGGAEGLSSSPVLLVQPGRSVSASIGSDPATGSCHMVEAIKAVLANGVSLGSHDLGICDNMVGYPFVDAGNGSLTHPESEAPATTATGSCVGNVGTSIELASPTLVSGHRHQDVIVIRPTEAGSCTLSGYPDVRQLSPSGVLQLIAVQSPNGPAGGISGSMPPTVTVTPTSAASVLIEWSDQGKNCAGDGGISFRLGGGGYSTNDRTGPVCDLQVHPFVAGTTGSD